MFKHVLVATDGSAAARRAGKAAIALARRLGAKVTACSVVETYPAVALGAYADPKTLGTIAEDQHRLALERAAAVCKMAQGRCGLRTALTTRLPLHEGIIAAAKKQRCDLIVMGSHGRRGVSKLVLGSVAQKVLERSEVPVLVFR